MVVLFPPDERRLRVSRIPTITGLGLVTPLATGVDATWRALLDGRFITNHARTQLDAASADRVHRLAVAAAAEAAADAGWKPGGFAAGRTALVLGTSKGAVELHMTAPPAIGPSTSDNPSGCPFGLASIAAAVRGSLPLLDGPSITLSAACASGLHALIRASMMIRNREADRVLVVAAEASVNPLFLGSFKRLGVLPREDVGCRPFDETRDGFLMSEASAAVCLEASESDARSGGRSPYAVVERYGLAGDATHMTGGDPDGSTLRYLLEQVVAARPVDLIHAHGTGTPFNDPIELAALDDACGTGDGSAPLVYSHKGALGHSLGAAGLVSIALNCVMHARQTVAPNVQTRRPLKTRRVRIRGADAKSQANVRRSLAVAAGFGGPTAVVSLVSP